MPKLIFLIIIFATFAASCRKTDDFRDEDDILIRKWLSVQQITYANNDANTGLYWYFLRSGTATSITSASFVDVKYTTELTDGTLVYSTANDTATVYMKDAIAGWQLGLPHFGKGSAGVLLVPSRLAYGAAGLPPAIPANTVLIFRLELLDVR